MKKSKGPSSGKLLWAFNPFQDSFPALKSAANSLLKLSRQAAMKPEPVYVVSPAEVNVVLEFSVPAKERYGNVALAKSRQVLKSLQAEHLEPTILIEKSLSLTASTRALAKYAEKEGAEAILTGTRSGKSFGQSLLGSFAETLLHQARCPVILVNPGRHIRGPLRRLLFVSDLSADSLKIFGDFCSWAAALDAEVFLFHSVPRPFSWASFAVDSLLGPDRMSEKQYLISIRDLREKDVKPFQEAARRQGVAFSYQIGIGGDDIAEETLRLAKKRKVDMIGAAGMSGRLKARMLGSVTKSLLQQTKIPLWIKHGSH